MMGASPTLPGALPVMPPVEVAAASRPAASSATAPTVPKGCSPPGWKAPEAAFAAQSGRAGAVRPSSPICASRAPQRCSVKKKAGGSASRPCARAKASAPSPISITWSERSITARATLTGWREANSPATAPADRVEPSITAASSSFVPVEVKTAPRPALNRGSSSSTRTAASTASSAVPPWDRTPDPASSAAFNPARYCACSGASSATCSATPAPPWIARAQRG